MLSLTEINRKINNQICYNTINILNDFNLKNEYLKTSSVKNKINKLKLLLIKNEIDTNKIDNILNEYLFDLIPSGTKAVIRGNLFNKIIKEHIINLNLNNEVYELLFENKNNLDIDEIPDWTIRNKLNNKIVIGMNQLDLWNRGHQINRAFKYLNFKKDNIKLLCVICNHIQLTSTNNKTYKLFNIGFQSNSLCYIKDIENIIKEYLST